MMRKSLHDRNKSAGATAKLRRTACLLLLTSLYPTSTLIGQTPDDATALKKKLDALQHGQDEIRKELESIREILTVQRNLSHPNPNVSLSLGGAPSQGDQAAKITIVEFFDYQCPFCGLYFSKTLPQIVSEYIRAGKVRYVLQDFPLVHVHVQAFKAAEAAHCATDQGKFWPMHDQLMANPGVLDRPSLSRYAQGVGLNVPAFDKCVDSDKYASIIRQEKADGEKAGVAGTPTFFLGVTDPNGKTFKSLEMLEGFVPFAQMKASIDRLLVEQDRSKPTTAPTSP